MKKFWRWSVVGLSLSLALVGEPSFPRMVRSNPSMILAQRGDFEEVKQLFERAKQLRDQGKYSEAIPLAERAVAIARETLSPQDPKLATTLNNLAALYESQGQYAKAEPLYQQSLEIRRQALGENHPDYAQSLNNLAGLYESQGQYAKAEPLYLKSLEINRQALGENHPHVATTLNNLALLYQSQGQYAKAEPLYQQSLEIRRQALGENHPDYAQSLNNLAELYRAQGQYAKAEPLYLKSLEIKRKALGEDHPSVARTLNNLAALYESQGQYAKAEPLYLKSLEIKRKALGEDHPSVARTLNNLAALYKSQGQYAKAEPLYLKSLEIKRKALGEDHPSVATTLNNLAGLYESQGQYAKAEPLYQQSLEIRRQALGENHPDYAQSLNNLAGLYESQGQYAKAEPLYLKSLEINRQALGENHPHVATTLNNLALLYKSQGQYAKAEPLYQQSLEIRRQALGENHPDYAQSLNNLAELYRAQGQYAKAEPLFLQSLEIIRQALGEKHPSVATTLGNVSILHWAKNDIPTALQYQQDELDIEETNLITNLTNGDEVQKRAFLSLYQGSTNVAISFHHQGAPQNQAVADLAYTTLLRRKGRLLDVLSEANHQLLNSPDAKVKLKLQALKTTRSKIASLTSRNPREDKQQQQTYSQQLQTLTDEENQLTQDLLQLSPQLGGEANPEKVNIPAVQQAIPKNAALVELVEYEPFYPKAKLPQDRWGEPRYAVYVLTRSGSVKWQDLGPVSEIQEDLIKFINAVQSDSISKEGFQAIASPLYQKIFQPIRQLVGSKTHLLISPDGELNRIPFEALIDQENKYLIETYQFTYLSSGRDLLKFKPKQRPVAQSSLLMAGPDYNSKKRPSLQASTTPVSPGTTRGIDTRSIDIATEKFTLLTGAQEEGEAIATMPNSPFNFETKYDTEATERLLKQRSNPRILHIATHGVFLKRKQEETQTDQGPAGTRQTHLNIEPLLKSGLILAGRNDSTQDTDDDDGLLTAYEVTGLDLRATQMVVMSACQTGTGEIESGDGVYGLRRAFTLAGAQSQVMSLWDVGDDSTKKLMVAYYKRLSQGGERGAALRAVQLEMLNGKFNDSEKDINYTSPNHWAAFIRTGDWRPLQ